MQIFSISSQIVSFPNYTSKNHALTVFRLVDYNPSSFDYSVFVKFHIMSSDTRFLTPDLKNLSEAEISIFDCNGFSARHLWSLITNFSTMRVFLRYVQEAAPFIVSQNHFVNCSTITMKIFALIRPFLNKELFDVMHFHSYGFETLHNHIPKELLPDEYGGSAGKLEELYVNTLRLIELQNDYLKDECNWKLLN